MTSTPVKQLHGTGFVKITTFFPSLPSHWQKKSKKTFGGQSKIFLFLVSSDWSLLLSGGAGSGHLVTLAVVLQAPRPLAVAALAVSAVRLALLALADLWLEGAGVAVQTRLKKNK